MIAWYREFSPAARKNYWGCYAGWSLDNLDFHIFLLAIPALIAALGISKTEAGMLGSVTLIASALGGWVIGAISDRYGRVRTLKLTIIWFAFFTFLCGLAQNFPQLAVLRAMQGFGFGGEWGAGAVLVAESIKSQHRGKVMGSLQSGAAVGWAVALILATGLFLLVPPDYAWRVLFMVGLLPALLVIFMRRHLSEPPRNPPHCPTTTKPGQFTAIFHPGIRRKTLLGLLVAAGGHGAAHAVLTWWPTFLHSERHLSVLAAAGYMGVMIAGSLSGSMISAALQDRLGRRHTIMLFAGFGMVLVPSVMFLPIPPSVMLFLGFPLGVAIAGIVGCLGALLNELYPTALRGTGVGFCYNCSRILAAILPSLVGFMSESMPLGHAIGIDAALAYLLALVAVWFLPETKGKSLAEGEGVRG
ncbi:MAG: MFS transporter [Candidatus Symbiobacter sp.]|nr:MFS transporter [Candidatus Symbiobacter sp.]